MDSVPDFQSTVVEGVYSLLSFIVAVDYFFISQYMQFQHFKLRLSKILCHCNQFTVGLITFYLSKKLDVPSNLYIPMIKRESFLIPHC